MLNMSKHLTTLNAMKSLGIATKLTNTHTQQQLHQGCLAAGAQGILDEQVRGYPHIQHALITRPEFPVLYRRLLNLNVSPQFVEEWLGWSEETRCYLWNYGPEEIHRVSQIPNLSVRARQDYLLYYAPMCLDAEQTTILIENLTYSSSSDDICLAHLTEEQRQLLLRPFVCHSLLSYELKDTLPLLSGHSAVTRLLDSLYRNGVEYFFSLSELRLLKDLLDSDCALLEQVHYLLGSSSERTSRFLTLWLENHAPMSDVSLLLKKLPLFSAEEVETMLSTKLAYLNALYAGALDGVPFDAIPEYMLPLLVYAIDKKQNTFMRLFASQFEAIRTLNQRSMLFQEAFYTRIHLNSLTEQNLRLLQKPQGRELMLSNLNDRIYTFAELYLMAYAPEQYIDLFNLLTALRSDERLIVLRQLIKRAAVAGHITQQQRVELAKRLCIKPLSAWKAEEFAHIPEITYPQCAAFLSSYSTIGRFLPQLHTADEAEFAARNADALAAYHCWQEVQEHLSDIDTSWKELAKALELDASFISEHTPAILRFLARNGAAIAMDYVSCQGNPEGFYRILRAELMGQLPLLKYHGDDLTREIEYPISDQQKLSWMTCNEAVSAQFAIAEKDDFFTTMRIGEVPDRTCLHYRKGSQRECLLACFDANKKFLLAYRNGQPVARAMLRLTKAADQLGQGPVRLEFADLRKAETSDEQSTAPQERLVLFLERMYDSGINNEERMQIRRSFIAFTEEKADELNATAYLATEYFPSTAEKNYVTIPCNLFISKSKSGSQYLDSLGGANTISNEGKYHKGVFLTRVE